MCYSQCRLVHEKNIWAKSQFNNKLTLKVNSDTFYLHAHAHLKQDGDVGTHCSTLRAQGAHMLEHELRLHVRLHSTWLMQAERRKELSTTASWLIKTASSIKNTNNLLEKSCALRPFLVLLRLLEYLTLTFSITVQF